MRTVQGTYDGKVVRLAEAVPVTQEVPVTVTFPDLPVAREAEPKPSRKWRWQEVGDKDDGCRISVVDLLLQERDEERR